MKRDYQKPYISIVSVNLPPLLTDSLPVVGGTTVESPTEILSRPSADFSDGTDIDLGSMLLP